MGGGGGGSGARQKEKWAAHVRFEAALQTLEMNITRYRCPLAARHVTTTSHGNINPVKLSSFLKKNTDRMHTVKMNSLQNNNNNMDTQINEVI